jgi:hypothetical protein
MRTAVAALVAMLTVFTTVLPAGATTKPVPAVGATINIAAIPGADGAYQVTLLQVYNRVPTWTPPVDPQPPASR